MQEPEKEIKESLRKTGNSNKVIEEIIKGYSLDP
jgi:hypothetical protein